MTLEQIINQIKSIQIQGASNICRASLAAWRDYLLSVKTKDVKKYLAEAKRVGARLALARPNEPLTVNSLNYLNDCLGAYVKNNRQRQIIIDVPSLQKITRQSAQDFSMLLHANGQKIASYGAVLIKSKQNIFTHCHSRTVVNILARAKEQKKVFHVYNDETRPLFQGRRTSEELLKRDIKNTMVVDSAAPFIVSDHSGDDIKIHQVILGFDVIRPDGSALNKIGSFGMALTAYESGIPVFLAGSLMKYSPNQKMKIELRCSAEVWPQGPKNLAIINYAFDKIPARFITGYITELGLVKPKDIKKMVKKNYGWIEKKQRNKETEK